MCAKIFRTSISIPADLKRRMDKTREPVSWSQVACAAIEKKLGEFATRKERKTMTDVVQRLRASKFETEDELYQDGYTAGEKWARDKAKVTELRRLESWKAQSGDYWENSFQMDAESAFGPDAMLYFALRPKGDRDRASAKDFWSEIMEEESNLLEGQFIRGFAEGALEIWAQVKSAV